MSSTGTINRTTEIAARLGGDVLLSESIENLAATYRTAKPFPHIVIDNLFSNELLDSLVDEIPSVNDDQWVHHDDERVEKYGLRSAVELGKTGFQLTALLHSAAFLYFLSEVTGIWELLPDPYLQGAGYSLIPRGAKFDVHCDRNTLYETGLARRLSLIVYLNKEWRHEYGGQLELWNHDGTQCETVVEPLFNRTVVFEIADRNYHGIPAAIAAPLARSRKSFNVYYHTTRAHGNNAAPPHTSIYAPAFYQKKSTRHKLVRDFVPPILLRTLKRARSRKVY